MVVMEGERQGQGGQGGQGWYEGGAGTGATSPLPTTQHHQVGGYEGIGGSLYNFQSQEAPATDSDNYFKTTTTASQYFMQSAAYGGIQSHGEFAIFLFSVKSKCGWPSGTGRNLIN